MENKDQNNLESEATDVNTDALNPTPAQGNPSEPAGETSADAVESAEDTAKSQAKADAAESKAEAAAAETEAAAAETQAEATAAGSEATAAETQATAAEKEAAKETGTAAEEPEAVPKKKHKTGKIVGLICGALVIAAGGGYVYAAQQYTDHFIAGTSINGIDVSKMTAEEAEAAIKAQAEDYAMTVSFPGGTTETISAEIIGYS